MASTSLGWRKRGAVWAPPEDIPQEEGAGVGEDTQVVQSNAAGLKGRGREIVWVHEMSLQAGLRLVPYTPELRRDVGKDRGSEMSPHCFRLLMGNNSKVENALREKRGVKVPYLTQCKYLTRMRTGESFEIEGPALSGKTTTLLLSVIWCAMNNPKGIIFVITPTLAAAEDAIDFIKEVGASVASKVALCNSRPLAKGIQISIGTGSFVSATCKGARYHDRISMICADNGLLNAKPTEELLRSLPESVQRLDVQASNPSPDVTFCYSELPKEDKAARLKTIVQELTDRGERVAVYPGIFTDEVRDALVGIGEFGEVEEGGTLPERCTALETWARAESHILIASDATPKVPLPVTTSIFYGPAENAKDHRARCCRMQKGLALALAGYDKEEEDASDGGRSEEDGVSDSQGDTLSLAGGSASASRTATQSHVSGDDVGVEETDSESEGEQGLTEEGLLAQHAASLHAAFTPLAKGKLEALSAAVKGGGAAKFDDNFDYRLKSDTWAGMMLNTDLLRGMSENNVSTPSPIQARAIPAFTSGSDVVLQAASGTGKTLLMGICILQRLQFSIQECQAVFLVATRELAAQASMMIVKLSRHQRTDLNVVGDATKKPTPRIIVSTPGEAEAAHIEPILRSAAFATLAVDDADLLMTQDSPAVGFLKIAQEAKAGSESRAQFITGSTFWSDDLLSFVTQSADDNVKVIRCDPTKLLPPLMKHFTHKAFVKEIALTKVLKAINGPTIIFCEDDDSCDAAHSGMEKVRHLLYLKKWDKEKKQEVMKQFGPTKYLVTDDLTLSRGFDFPDMKAVVNFDVPQNLTDYIMQAGRAARFGKCGAVVTLIDALDLVHMKKEVTAEDLKQKAADRKSEWEWVSEAFAPYEVPRGERITSIKREPRERNAAFESLTEFGLTPVLARYVMRLAHDAAPIQMLREAISQQAAMTRPEVGALVEAMKNGWLLKKGLENEAWDALTKGVQTLCSPVSAAFDVAKGAKRSTKKLCIITIDKRIAASKKESMTKWCALRRKQREHIRVLWGLWKSFMEMQWDFASAGLTGLRPKKKRFGGKSKCDAKKLKKQEAKDMESRFQDLFSAVPSAASSAKKATVAVVEHTGRNRVLRISDTTPPAPPGGKGGKSDGKGAKGGKGGKGGKNPGM